MNNRILFFTMLVIVSLPGLSLDPELQNYQNVSEQAADVMRYKRFIKKGVTPTFSVDARKRRFIANAIKWALNQRENTIENLEHNLEKNAFLANLIFKTQKPIQEVGFLTMPAQKVLVSSICQNNFTLLFETYRNLPTTNRTPAIERFYNHGLIWWGTLSIRRTKQHFAQAWDYLGSVSTLRYTRSARLWQAHLILVNRYEPRQTRQQNLALARELLESLDSSQLVPQALQALAYAHAGAADDNGDNADAPPFVALSAGQPVPNLLVVANPNPAVETLTVHPDFVSQLQPLKQQLLAELAKQEALEAQMPHHNETSDDQTDSDSDDDEDHGPSGGRGGNSPPERDHDDATDSDTDVDDQEEHAPALVDERLHWFLQLISTERTAIDNLAIEVLNAATLPADLAEMLGQAYAEITPIKSTDDLHDVSVVRLIYHYSQTLFSKKSKVNAAVFAVFGPLLKEKVVASRYLTMQYHYPAKDNHEGQYEQLLAYREEILQNEISKNKVVTHYDAQFHLRSGGRWKPTKISFPKEEIKQIVSRYVEDSKAFYATYAGKNFNKIFTVLWFHLPKENLPAQRLGNLRDKLERVKFTKEQLKFLETAFDEGGIHKEVAIADIRIKFNRHFQMSVTDDLIRTRFRSYEQGKSIQTAQEESLSFYEKSDAVIEDFLRRRGIITFNEFNAALGDERDSLSKAAFSRRLKSIRERVGFPFEQFVDAYVSTCLQLGEDCCLETLNEQTRQQFDGRTISEAKLRRHLKRAMQGQPNASSTKILAKRTRTHDRNKGPAVKKLKK